MEFKFNLEKFVKAAEELGIEVKVDSPTPGIFSVDVNGDKEKVKIEEIFADFWEEV